MFQARPPTSEACICAHFSRPLITAMPTSFKGVPGKMPSLRALRDGTRPPREPSAASGEHSGCAGLALDDEGDDEVKAHGEDAWDSAQRS